MQAVVFLLIVIACLLAFIYWRLGSIVDSIARSAQDSDPTLSVELSEIGKKLDLIESSIEALNQTVDSYGQLAYPPWAPERNPGKHES